MIVFSEVRTCSAAEFDCGSDQCIPMRWSCDGVPDCDNESDEEESFCSKLSYIISVIMPA